MRVTLIGIHRPQSLQSSLLHATGDRAQASVHFSGRRAQNQRDDCVAGNLDILERTEDMYFPVRDQLTRACRGQQKYVSLRTYLRE